MCPSTVRTDSDIASATSRLDRPRESSVVISCSRRVKGNGTVDANEAAPECATWISCARRKPLLGFGGRPDAPTHQNQFVPCRLVVPQRSPTSRSRRARERFNNPAIAAPKTTACGPNSAIAAPSGPKTEVLDRPRPRRADHTICTAVAPELVFTVRTYATSAPYEATTSAHIRTSRPTNSQVTALQSHRTHHSDKCQEGHIYQASAEAGVSSRSELSDLVQQFQALE
jgi:hypothetical protein